MRAIDHRNGRTPIALTRNAPVAQTELHFLLSQPLGCELGCNGVNGVMHAQAVEFAGVDKMRFACLVAIPFLPGIGREGFTVNRNHLLDRKTKLFGKCKVSFIVSRDSHHGAFAVAHEDVVGNPDFNGFTRERMLDVKARRDALLFHGSHVGFRHAALGAFSNEGLQIRTIFGEVGSEGMFGSDGDERHAHERIGTSRINGEALLFAGQFVREAKRHAFGTANPVLLHAANLFGPAVKRFDVVEEFLRVLRNAEVITRNFALFNNRAGAPAAAFNNLLVGQHSLVDRVPVDDLGLTVGNASFQHLEEQPLVPPIVLGLAGSDFTRPVESKTQGLHLGLHIGDVAVCPRSRLNLFCQGGIFGRQSEGIPAHRRHDVVALHAVEAVHDVI